MPTIPRRAVDEYTRGVNAASRSAVEVLVPQLEALDWDAPVGELRDAIVALMRPCCESAAESAAAVAAEFYDAARASEVGSALGAVPDARYNPDATEGAVRAFVQDVVDGKGPRPVIRRCRERVDYEAKKAAANAIRENVRRDRARPRYARVPSGTETCRFCIMLASRGPVYRNADSAGEGEHWHANCDCRIVPMWGSLAVVTDAGGVVRRGGTQVEGYDPDALFEGYLESMRDPEFAESVREKLEAAGGGVRAEGGGDGGAWAVANGQGVTTYHDIHELTAAIRDAATYEELFEVLATLDRESGYYGLPDKVWDRLFELARGRRDALIGGGR